MGSVNRTLQTTWCLAIQMLFNTFVIICIFHLSWSAPGPVKEEKGRIVNGEEAPVGSLPYQASLQLRVGDRLVSSKSMHFCGGAFIAKDWIVTASHCVKGQQARMLKIVGGTNDITDSGSPTFGVEEVITNDYNDVTKMNDIALLRLDMTTYNLEMRTAEGHPTTPIQLCPESFEPQGRDCTVSGWGHLKSKGSGVPDMLREVQVKVLHDSICQKMLAGGPLVCKDDAGDRCLAGVVSWGVGCATEGIPGVYTNVRKYDQWIRDKMNAAATEMEPRSQ